MEAYEQISAAGYALWKCPSCGVVIHSPDIHTEWHQSVERGIFPDRYAHEHDPLLHDHTTG